MMGVLFVCKEVLNCFEIVFKKFLLLFDRDFISCESEGKVLVEKIFEFCVLQWNVLVDGRFKFIKVQDCVLL